ncbi:hypothetical protein [Dactylosporangium sp. NPDC005555]|uniref:hypothetical protein n=1 Tax=Dactylosporangium sp. NPDC005555 TaxID=3154889 RepID=UPI0033B90860
MGAFIRRMAPVAGLLVLAPFAGEFLLGNLSVRLLPAWAFLVPMYGGGALLIRELVRRTGFGWPAILLLGAAYGVIEAGLADQALFNPSFEGHDFQAVTPVPALGISALNTMSFVTGHAVWSIALPIAVVEHLTPARRTTPWLGRAGLVGTLLLYVWGLWIIFRELYESEGFLATPAQRTGAAVVAALLVAAAFVTRRPTACGPALPGGWVPRPWLAGAGGFVLSGVFVARPESWTGVWMGAALLLLAAVVVSALARRPQWTQGHHVAFAGGVLLTYAWLGFVLTWLMDPGDPVRWWGNAGFALAAVALLAWCERVTRRGPSTVDGQSSASPASASPTQ